MTIQLRKILACVEFGEITENVLRQAAELARTFQSELVVCYVADEAGLLSRLPLGGEGYIPPNLPALQEQFAKDELARLKSSQIVPETARLIVGHGNPATEIVRLAKEENVDLIVQGTHGRGAIAHALMGSVAERTVRSAPCPVLTVRAMAAE